MCEQVGFQVGHFSLHCFLLVQVGLGDDTNNYIEVANTLIIALYNFKCGWSNLILGISILLHKVYGCLPSFSCA